MKRSNRFGFFEVTRVSKQPILRVVEEETDETVFCSQTRPLYFTLLYAERRRQKRFVFEHTRKF